MDTLEASRYGKRFSRFHHRPPSWKKIRSKFFKFQKSSSRFNRTRVSRLANSLVNQCHLDSSLELFLFMVNTSSINEQVYSQTNPNDSDKLMVTQQHGILSLPAWINALNFENFRIIAADLHYCWTFDCENKDWILLKTLFDGDSISDWKFFNCGNVCMIK